MATTNQGYQATAPEASIRLTDAEVAAIREVMQGHVAPLSSARLWLFGSRVEPSKRGGDIDLYLEVDVPIADVLTLVRELRLALYSRIGEQRIDVVVKTTNTDPSALHELAKIQGVLLWQHPKSFVGST